MMSSNRVVRFLSIFYGAAAAAMAGAASEEHRPV
jgi:hypothetical protein